MKRALVLMVVFALFVQLGSVATLAAPIQEAAGPTVEETILATQPDAEGMPGRPDPHGSNVDRPAAATTQATSPLYPDDMDPPESCPAPVRRPVGKGVGILVVPWLGGVKS